MLIIGLLVQQFIILQAERLENVSILTSHETSDIPVLWAMKLLSKAKQDKKIQMEAPCYAQLHGGFEKIENANYKLLKYAWINFPLSYTQVYI